MTRNVAIAEFFYCIIALIFLLVGIKALRTRVIQSASAPRRSGSSWPLRSRSAPICLTDHRCVRTAIAALTAANRVVQSASDVPEG
jgi:hypothetical protein